MTVFYGAINLLRHRPFFGASGNPVLMIIAGPVIHLWLLPFMMLGILLLPATLKAHRPGLGSGYIFTP